MITSSGVNGCCAACGRIAEVVLVPRRLASNDAALDARLPMFCVALPILEVIATDSPIAAVVVEAMAPIVAILVRLEVAVEVPADVTAGSVIAQLRSHVAIALPVPTDLGVRWADITPAGELATECCIDGATALRAMTAIRSACVAWAATAPIVAVFAGVGATFDNVPRRNGIRGRDESAPNQDSPSSEPLGCGVTFDKVRRLWYLHRLSPRFRTTSM